MNNNDSINVSTVCTVYDRRVLSIHGRRLSSRLFSMQRRSVHANDREKSKREIKAQDEHNRIGFLFRLRDERRELK